MRVEVLIWILANAVSFFVSLRDLRVTTRVWRWTRINESSGEMHMVAKRNFRASVFRFALASMFVLAGVFAALPQRWVSGLTIWALIAGAIVLAIDIVLESRYRGRLFASAQRKADEEHFDGKARRVRIRKGCD